MEQLELVKEAALILEKQIAAWEPILSQLDNDRITLFRNRQNRNIKQIVGHLIDSCVNNHHRIVRLQYLKRLTFPDYQPDNDTWIAIQQYESKDWQELVQLWKFYSRHIAYIIRNADPKDYNNLWTDGFITPVALADIMIDFPKHFQLHLDEIQDLMNK